MGNALPGVFNIAARAMGVTTEELNKLTSDYENTFNKKIILLLFIKPFTLNLHFF